MTLVGIGWRLARQGESSVETRWVGLLLLAALTAYLCNGMFQDMTIIPMVHMFLFFLAGIGVTVYQNGLVQGQPESIAARTTVAPSAIAT